MDLDLFSLKTPCFLFNLKEFHRSVSEFKTALNKNFERTIVGYSIKTNSLPYLIAEANRSGCYAETVSYDEYELAIRCGFPTDRIIYNGPLKSKQSFLKVITDGGIVNIETKRELEWLKDLPGNETYNIGLRININISKVSPEDTNVDNDNSRFGFSEESGELDDAIRFVRGLTNIRLAGVHIHRTSPTRSPRFYYNIVKYAAGIIKRYDIDLDYLDVGGGYWGFFPNQPTFRDYSDAIFKALKDSGIDGVTIIVEPGNALVASSFSFLSEVIDYKRIDDNINFVTIDASRNDIDPFFRKTDYLKEILYKNQERRTEGLQIIGGCTCLEYDRLFSLENYPQLLTGDRIYFKNVGAYTSTLSPLFIRYFPRVYVIDENNIRIIRGEWSAEDFLCRSFLTEH